MKYRPTRKTAIIVLLAIVLAVGGYSLYRYSLATPYFRHKQPSYASNRIMTKLAEVNAPEVADEQPLPDSSSAASAADSGADQAPPSGRSAPAHVPSASNAAKNADYSQTGVVSRLQNTISKLLSLPSKL